MSPKKVQELVAEIERKDLSTAAHTWRVVLYTRAILESFGVEHDQIELVTKAAALHDIGKIDIPDRILQKPGALSDEEYEIVKLHPVTGFARMLELGVSEDPILNIVRYHHERWDGLGYPYKLKGEEIPMGPRLFAVIDSFDAMTSVRPYRSELGDDAARRALIELQAGSGTRYWAQGVEAFTDLFHTGRLDYILHYFNDEVPVPAFAAARKEEFDTIRKRYEKRS
jgi:HD-GYP domain-containing protein (c-di-GMP phosphodiesterase class II)